MGWLSRNDWTNSDKLFASMLNSLANDDRAWGGNVNGGGWTLSNVAITGIVGNSIATSPFYIVQSGDSRAYLTFNSSAPLTGNRWSIVKDDAAESGSNAGSNLAIYRYSDTGVYLGTPFSINRATGNVAITQNLGVGTSAPTTRLHLSQSASASLGPVIMLENPANQYGDAVAIRFFDQFARAELRMSLQANGSDLIYYSGSAGSTEVFRATGAGLFGINMSVPNHILHVGGVAPLGTAINSAMDMLRLQVDVSGVGQDDNIRIRSLRSAAGSSWSESEWRIQRSVQASMMGYIAFSNQDVAFGCASTEVMRVTANSRVGIGTNAPPALLTVSGSGQTSANFDPNGDLRGVIMLDDVGAAYGSGGAILFSAGSTGWRIAAIKAFVTSGGGNTQGDLTFSTRRLTTDATLTEAMRITGVGGFVGINKGPAYPLDVNGQINATGFLLNGAPHLATLATEPDDLPAAGGINLWLDEAGNRIAVRFRKLDGSLKTGYISIE